MTTFVTDVLFVMLAVTGIAVIRTRNLFAAVMLAGIYSLVSAGLFVVMDAVDVAFMEAAVGAGISTVLMLGTLALVGYREAEPKRSPLLPMFVVVVTGAILIYGTSELPPFGAADNPAHQHVAPHYLEESEHEIHIPNVVTSVLASYRGYDTMGETAVIFTAMVGVLLLLARGPLPRRVFHQGRWITVRPGTTREELEAMIAEEEVEKRPPTATETGTLSSHREDGTVYREDASDDEEVTDG
jgi:multicomponent Na+:H+ antiporter subunit B